MEVGILMPYFIFLICTLLATAEMILFCILITWGTHQANAGSFSNLLLIVYYKISNGLYSFKSASGIHDSDPSLNLVRKSYPFVYTTLFRSGAFANMSRQLERQNRYQMQTLSQISMNTSTQNLCLQEKEKGW